LLKEDFTNKEDIPLASEDYREEIAAAVSDGFCVIAMVLQRQSTLARQVRKRAE
jgi:hypothetical protein